MRIVTDRETYRDLAADASPATRVPVEARLTVADPFAAYRRARGDDWGLCLETTGGQSGWGYFAVDPTERLTVGSDATVWGRSDTGGGGAAVDRDGSGATRDEADAARAEGEAGRDGTGAERGGDDGERDEGAGHGAYAEPSPTLRALEGVLTDERLRRGPCDVPFPGGWFGWLSYDVAREVESLPDGTTDDRGLPRAQFARFETVAAWEAPLDGECVLRLCSSPRLGEVGSEERDTFDPDAAYDAAVRRLEAFADRIESGDPSVGPPPAAAETVEFTSETGRAGYADRVRAVREYVRAGDTFQANVSHRLRGPAAVHPVETYAALRRVNPAPYSGLVEFRDADLVSASPELLLRRVPTSDAPTVHAVGDPVTDDGRPATDDQTTDGGETGAETTDDGLAAKDELATNDELAGDGELAANDESATDGERGTARLETEPIAGTRPRGETAAADRALAEELQTDEKERAEHAMLVDLERNDLGKVSVPGTVAVSEYRRVDRYASVMHLVSLVEGRERPDRSLADTLAAVFPGGTITGAPKPRTMEIIDELEETRRGPYTGSVAALGFDGRAVCNILIRTLVRTDGEYTLRVGAGVVHDSDPEREYEETLDKARGLVSALDDSLDASLDVTRRRDDPPTDPADAGSTDTNSTDTDSPDTDLTDTNRADGDSTDGDSTDTNSTDANRTDTNRPTENSTRSGDEEVRQ